MSPFQQEEPFLGVGSWLFPNETAPSYTSDLVLLIEGRGGESHSEREGEGGGISPFFEAHLLPLFSLQAALNSPASLWANELLEG